MTESKRVHTAEEMATTESPDQGKNNTLGLTQQEINADKVIVYLLEPSENVANLSPPCLKLETFLRMAKIPYTPVHGFNPSSKGKLPWIEYKGKAVADSNFCVEYLSKEFHVDVDEHLSAEQKAVATAFLVMLEENTYWTLVYNVWLTPYSTKIRDLIFKDYYTPMRYIFLSLTQRKIRACLHGHGIGRHTEEEMYGIAERDLRAMSTYLGQKKFLFGDKPCLTDAALFAIVAIFIWEMPESPQGVLINEQLSNLVEHAKSMKEMYFPDWDKITSKHSASE